MKKIPNKVLVVDDDPVMVRLAKKLLKNDGYEVHEAYSGMEGLELAEKILPDLVLLDVLMPDLDGREVARRLRMKPQTASIPVVFMTVTIDLQADKGNEMIHIDTMNFRGFAKPLHNRKILSVIRKEINKKVHHND
jgi:CheY-like chemotaxis protein